MSPEAESAALSPEGGGQVRIFRHYAATVWRLPMSRFRLVLALRAMLRALLAENAFAPPAVELHLVDDAAIGAANRRFMACAGPTNVLSFPGGADLPGILLFSVDTLARECLLYGQEPERHALWLLAHGMGHLAGLDHGSDMDRLCGVCFAAAQTALDA